MIRETMFGIVETGRDAVEPRWDAFLTANVVHYLVILLTMRRVPVGPVPYGGTRVFIWPLYWAEYRSVDTPPFQILDFNVLLLFGNYAIGIVPLFLLINWGLQYADPSFGYADGIEIPSRVAVPVVVVSLLGFVLVWVGFGMFHLLIGFIPPFLLLNHGLRRVDASDGDGDETTFSLLFTVPLSLFSAIGLMTVFNMLMSGLLGLLMFTGYPTLLFWFMLTFTLLGASLW